VTPIFEVCSSFPSGALGYVRPLLATGARCSARPTAPVNAGVLVRFREQAAKQNPNRVAPPTATEFVEDGS